MTPEKLEFFIICFLLGAILHKLQRISDKLNNK